MPPPPSWTQTSQLGVDGLTTGNLPLSPVPYAASAGLKFSRREGREGQVEQTCNHDLNLPQGGVPYICEKEVYISRHAALFRGAWLGLPLLCIQHNECTL